MDGQEKLAAAIQWLQSHYRKVPVSDRMGLCLQTVRQALQSQGLSLPWNAKPRNLAIEAFKDLKANPGKWGWRQVSHPLPRYTIVFFGGCGELPDGRMAGHVAIYDQKARKLYADTVLSMTKSWGDKLKGAFVPKE